MNDFPEKIKVLLIDDDEEDYILTKYLFDDFKDRRYTLDWTDDGAKALDSMKAGLYDIYFVDYRLGEYNGLEILREAVAAGCLAPIILMTGQGDAEVDNQAMKAGAADYLVKGEIDAPLLERVIRYSLQQALSVEKLQSSESKFRSVIQSAGDGIFLVDADGLIRLWNTAAEKMFGFTNAEIIGQPATRLMGAKYAAKYAEIALTKTTLEVLAGMSGKTIESVGRRKDGSEFPLELSGSIWETGEGCFFTTFIRDITDRKETEVILQRNALFDSLTNLPNRAQFMNHLETAIEKGADNNFAVLFLDLDRFKIINDSLGHLIGDKLLITIAERIKASLRPGDVVARMGGDEFTILIHNVRDTSDATTVADRIQARLTRPFRLDNYEVFSSASIGIIISDKTKRSPEEFLRDADSAMYRAKESGKARYEIFDDEMHVRNMNLMQVETDLRKAIERREFLVYYQPIVNNLTGGINELEALIRWQHPKHGLVAPDEFINVAEETGLIIPIGEWVLEESCRQTKLWQTTIPQLKDLSISVNLSAKQLMHPSLVEKVLAILHKTGLDINYLKLEVTETTVMENGDVALYVLNELSAVGINFSTDDFGTGYSSLSYLHKYPFNRLKIDRSFISKMDTDTKSVDIIRTILMLGNNLNLEVVAEGIETESQLQKLQRMGLPLGQGYLFSKPKNAVFTEQLLKEGLPGDLFPDENFKITAKDGETIIELETSQ